MTPSQLAEFKALMDTYNKTLLGAGFSRLYQPVPTLAQQRPLATRQTQTTAEVVLREAIRRDKIARQLQAHWQTKVRSVV